MELVYKNEKLLFIIMLIISLLAWGGLLIGTKGIVLLYLFSFFIFYLFAQSAFISYLKGTGVKITASQFPDLHERIVACAQKLEYSDPSEAYLIHGNGAFNALATRFLGRSFIVLFSDIVDALEDEPEALSFYIGHEIGHLKRNHLKWGPVLFPASILPLLGSAYSRAREYTCDRHGFASCNNPESAQRGLGALAAGRKRWRTMSNEQYISQTSSSSGFWMSLHELISDYPWLTKRAAALHSLAKGESVTIQPRRSILAWIIALFIPRLGLGGGAASGLITIAMIGVLAAIAIPAYQDYVAKAQVMQAISVGKEATTAFTSYYNEHHTIPDVIAQTGFTPLSTGAIQDITINQKNGAIQISLSTPALKGKSIIFTPKLDKHQQLFWLCSSPDIPATKLPADCHD